MSKNNSHDPSVQFIEFEAHAYNVNNKVITPEPNPSTLLTDLLQSPLCYFQRRGGIFDMYVSVVLEGEQEIRDPTIELIGETYFLRLPFFGEASLVKKIVYLKFSNVPKPRGYKIPSVSVEVVPGLPTGEGAKTTTVDYEDADEEIQVIRRPASVGAQGSV